MGTIRFILALAVIASHSGPIPGLKLMGGGMAVQVFYVISGFYMSLILNEKYVTQPNAYRLFISNRFLRLFPIYWLILGLTFLFLLSIYRPPAPGDTERSALQLYAEFFHHMNFGTILFLIFTNVFLFFQDIVMFLGLNTTTGHLFFIANYRNSSPAVYQFLFVPQAWTVGVELLFYLIAPFIVRKRLKLVAGLIVASFLLRFGLYHFGFHFDPWTYRFFPTELVYFLFGNIAYFIYRRIQTWHIKPLHLDGLWVATVLAGLYFESVPLPLKKDLFVLWFCLALPFIFLRTKNLKVDAYIGELSYPMYMSHMFLSSVFYWLYGTTPLAFGLKLALATTLFSILINELVAKRIEKFRQQRVKRSSPQPAASLPRPRRLFSSAPARIIRRIIGRTASL